MDFTREPVIETVITPKEGSKLVIRSSKGNGQEEYFVDAVEVITFGNSIFFRSLERPKPFLVPASDYEVLEVREARIVLKNVGLDRSIKIGGGREGILRTQKEPQEEKPEVSQELAAVAPEAGSGKADPKNDRKRDRRRQSRKRRDRVEASPLTEEEASQSERTIDLEERIILPLPSKPEPGSEPIPGTGSIFGNLFSPPPLISETISRYKERFKDAFYTKEEQEARLSLDPSPQEIGQDLVQEVSPNLENPTEIKLEQPAFGSFELSEEAEEEIYRQRHKNFQQESDPIEIKQPSSSDEEIKKEELKEESEVPELHKQENLPE